MKKRGSNSVPDFSHVKPMSASAPRDAQAPTRQPAKSRPGAIKPQTTSAKSGRRGQ